MKEPKMITMRIRRHGEPAAISKTVTIDQSQELRDQGWVGPGESMPDPPPPDVEVMELKVKDARAALETAQHSVRVAEGRLHEAIQFHHTALERIAKEPGIKAELARQIELEEIQQKAARVLAEAGNKPIPLGTLIASARSEIQSRYIRQNYQSDDHVVGKTEGGDYLIVANKRLYVQEKAANEAKEAAAKEAAIRARMTKSEVTI